MCLKITRKTIIYRQNSAWSKKYVVVSGLFPWYIIHIITTPQCPVIGSIYSNKIHCDSPFLWFHSAFYLFSSSENVHICFVIYILCFADASSF